MIFQDPLSSLHPFYKVGDQLVEAIRAHHDVSKAQARDRAVEMLGLVGIPEPRRRADAYPHEFSGGMRQRAMIAMALANDPKLLIADEPTTALDVTVQAQILELIERLQQRVRHRGRDHHPRPRRRRRDRRRDRGHVRRPDRRAGHARTRSSPRPSTPTPGACCARSRGWTRRAARRSCRSRGRPPSLINLPSRLLVPPALPLRARGAHAHRPGARRRSTATRATRSPACSIRRRASSCGRSCRPGDDARARRARP